LNRRLGGPQSRSEGFASNGIPTPDLPACNLVCSIWLTDTIQAFKIDICKMKKSKMTTGISMKLQSRYRYRYRYRYSSPWKRPRRPRGEVEV
jgi:hypothetical protein